MTPLKFLCKVRTPSGVGDQWVAVVITPTMGHHHFDTFMFMALLMFIYVPPTALRLDTSSLIWEGTRNKYQQEWTAQYVMGGFRPVVEGDYVMVGTYLVLLAIILNIPIIECEVMPETE